jgi:hypothetical protein
MNEIDKILFNCIVALGTIEDGAVVDLDTLIIDRRKAAQQIRQFILDEVIGLDDYIIKPSGNSRFDQEVQSEISGQNKLRESQRKKLREPMEED